MLSQTNIDSPTSSSEYLTNNSFNQGMEHWERHFGELIEENSGSVTFRQFKIAQNIDYIEAGTRYILYVKYEIPYSQIGAAGRLKIGFNSPEIEAHTDIKSPQGGIYEVKLKGVASEEYCQFFMASTVFGVHYKIHEVSLKVENTYSSTCESGTNGVSFGGYGGGLHMVDDRWIRTCGNKHFYHNTGIMRTDGTFQVGESRLLVNQDGKIGIGTTNPDELLTVKGNIHSREVLIDMEGAVAADYVFEKYYNGVSNLKEDYTMPTLEEVETFTKNYKHLPGIPSAKELDKNGMRLKEMTNLLLQKIEELTLYTIEQEKRLNKQSQEIEKQKGLNQDLLNRLEEIEISK